MFSSAHRAGLIRQLRGSKSLLFSSALLVLGLWLEAGSPQRVGAQVMEGELRVEVRDSTGLALAAKVELNGRHPQFRVESHTNAEGEARMHRVPFGAYQLRITSNGFQPFAEQVSIHSEVPQRVEAVLEVAPVITEITVEDSPPLLDTSRPGVVVRAGREQLADALGSTLGRSTIDVVTSMPGWLLEANAVLHPRGSEYDTQYVVDGMPFYDNRSLAFAPAFENDEFESVNVMTAAIPAEYGRRMGGVIALDTRRVSTPGRSFEADLQGGSYENYMASLLGQYRSESTSISAGLHGGHTDRYLDPPSLENFTNQANAGGFHLRLDRDVSARDRLSFYLRSERTGFQVPNDLVQQAAGQRQGRNGNETAGQVHYQRILSTATLFSLRGMVRDLSATLNSNAFSTPVYAEQDRGFRQGVLAADLSHQREHHSFKFGGDLRLSDIREQFGYADTGPAPETGAVPALTVNFHDQKRSTEASVFAQDQIHYGNFGANLGVRFDSYKLLIADQAFSPRVAVELLRATTGPTDPRGIRPCLRTAPDRKFVLQQRGRRTWAGRGGGRRSCSGEPCQLLRSGNQQIAVENFSSGCEPVLAPVPQLSRR